MPATSQITFVNECHSLESTEKRDAPKRTPRPPNAFILYRSDFLKRRAVPPEVEKRQQNLSRIAGQCWNMLPETEKAVWFGKAAAIRAEHCAKYPFYKTGPFRKDTKRLLTKDKRRGSATNSTHSSGRYRTRRTRTPYCEGMFAALHDSKFSSPESQASLISPTLASESLLPAPASLSPLTLPHLLSPFAFHTHSSRQDSPSATSDNSVIRGGQVGCLLDSPGSETPLCGLSQITPSEIGSSSGPHLTPQQHEDDVAFCVPYPGLEQPFKLRSDPATQGHLTLPSSSIFPSARYHLAENLSLLNDFNVTDTFAHFNQSLIPLYPWHSEELNTAE